MLHPVHRGVFAVGKPELTRLGRWSAALLACGRAAALSHDSAAAFWQYSGLDRVVHVSVPAGRHPRPRGLRVHRRAAMPRVRFRDRLCVADPIDTLIDLAPAWTDAQLASAVNKADKRGLFGIDAATERIAELAHQPGAARLLGIVQGHQRTDSELEKAFLTLVVDARLARPRTQQELLGYRVDFLWPELRLVVETDGLAYHRTPVQQAKDRRRDQRLTAAGYTCLRFTHAQITNRRGQVAATLRATMKRLST